MELGGNAPFLVFDDADLDAALDGAMVAKMRNAGEACTAANRFYVQAGIHDDFVQGPDRPNGSPAHRRRLRPGDAMRADDHAQGDREDRSSGLDGGSTGPACDYGRRPLAGPGYFYPPTVLVECPGRMPPIAHEEIFGPVAPLYRFETEDQAVRPWPTIPSMACAAYLYTGDLQARHARWKAPGDRHAGNQPRPDVRSRGAVWRQ